MARNLKRKRSRRSTKSKRARYSKTSLRNIAPKVMRYKLPYLEDIYQLNPTGINVAVQVFSVNGLFDPNISGVGHQPRGYDQLQSMYDHYCTTFSKITNTFTTSAATTAFICGISLVDNATPASTMQEYIEGYTTVYRTIPAQGGVSGSGHKVTLTLKASPLKFLSRSRYSSDMKGDVASNPTEQCYFHVWVASADGSDPAGVYNLSKLTYWGRFIEPKKPPIS